MICKEDWYEPDAGKVEDAFCGICGDKMDVSRNNGPSGGFAGAMAGHNRKYDVFSCPNRRLAWHLQAKLLKREIEKTPSNTLAEVMQEELDGILKDRTPTKEIKGW